MNDRNIGLQHGARVVLVLGAALASLALAPAASAGVQVHVGFNFVLPPGVHVSVSNFDPYYVGRVYYAPAAVWRPVYSFPVETAYGIVYQPYVYDGGHPVCRGYIPGPGYGYSTFVLEGHGRYDRGWYQGPYYRGGHDYAEHRDHGWGRHDHDSHHGRHGHGNRHHR